MPMKCRSAMYRDRHLPPRVRSDCRRDAFGRGKLRRSDFCSNDFWPGDFWRADFRHRDFRRPDFQCNTVWRSKNSRAIAQGFSLPMALFILVILGLLAVVLFRTIALGQLSVTQEVLSARAFLAADSGAQAAMMRLFPVSGAAASCTGGAGLSETLTVSGLQQCAITVVCSQAMVDSEAVYSVTSTGTCTAGSLRASRVIEVGAHELVE